MMKYARKNLLKQAEMQGNDAKIVQEETESMNMTMQHRKNQFKKQIQAHSQTGRSMIEMLGVLAIIAILSIGGIVMFRYAMNYYQADQIAHEMNLMRTDAQIKIAQGAEELVLGEPYDPISESTLGHIQFNDDYLVDFACAFADEKIIELTDISCHVANAYYIELQDIPEGVCRPLAELLNGMSNIIAFNVNENEYPEAGSCEAGNENVLNAVFSAEAVSELVVCKTKDDCEEFASTPYCDSSRHVCVRCYEDDQCAHTEYCEDNICKSCDEGLVWNGEECVECTEDEDCTTDTPKCNSETNTCEACPKNSFWDGEKCQEGCRENKHCFEDEYCHKLDGFSCTDEWRNAQDSGSCRKVNQDLFPKTVTVNGQTYYESNIAMNWWSIDRFCKALDKTSVTRANLGCENISLENDAYCTNAIMNKLKDLTGAVYWHWLESHSNSCYAYDVNLTSGSLSAPLYNKKNEHNELALCKSRG